jgi:WD40 repeat protein/tetratricopeptide (TPR) repeat protein
MVHLHSSEDVATYNQRSLKTLLRAISLSQGQFSLILVRCNYAWLTEKMLSQVKEASSIVIGELSLPRSVNTLYTTIQDYLEADKPQALSILNLQNVKKIEQVLNSTNQVREEFRKRFPFPLILWIDDLVLEKMIRHAPDFKSWAATSIKFEIPPQELIQFLSQKADQMFARVLDAGAEPFFNNGAVQLEIGTLQRQVLDLAQKDLQKQEIRLDDALTASLEFILGRDDYANDLLDEALEHYQSSLSFWQQDHLLKTDSIDERQVREREGVLLFYIGLCYCRQADLQPGQNQTDWQEAKSYFQQCINVFDRSNRQDLVAKFISQLGQVLRKIEDWQALENLAKKALELHQNLFPTQENSFAVQLAQDYGFLAEVALHRQKWRSAKHAAEKALQLLENSSIPKPKHRALSLLLLARARKHLGNLQLATLDLEQAQYLGSNSDPPLHQHDPQLYIHILQELRSLYFQQGRYLDAFGIKQEQHKIEHQYGFRAFIGATQLQPQQQALNPARDTLKTATVAHEIASASRARDIQRLVERVSRNDCKLTIIHGYSGVGKSSMVNAGLIPELRQKAIGDRIVLPVVLPIYTNWSRELGKRLSKAKFRPANSSDNEPETELITLIGEQIGMSPDRILDQLRHNISRNLLTVLVFDQFEEFFFVYPHQSERQEFYNFLCQCLNLPFVKIILSLREDYLHYLLEFDHIPNLDAINNNILDRSIRYSLGNFSPEDTIQVVRDLTQKTHFYLEPNLIDELVRDLSMELGQVRPIELQLVGAQLQEENITTLSQYLLLGANPKDELIERSLVQIVRDCGTENAKAAWKVLSALVDEKNTRPLRTKEELAEEIGESENLNMQLNGELQLSAIRSQLDLILRIFEGSGLVFLHREESGDRYQLVHDYLVRPIRQRDEVNLAKRLEKSEAAQQLSQQQLEQRNHQLKWMLGGLTCVTMFSMFSWQRVVAKNSELENQKREVETIARTATAETYLFSNKKFDALLESLRARKEWQDLKIKNGDYPTQLRLIATLQQAMSQVKERNRLEGHKDIVWDVTYSPNGKMIASASTDKTVKLWRSNGELIGEMHHDASVTKISFSPDNQLLATASWDKTIRLWQIDGTLLHTLNGHGGNVYSVNFSPDGRWIVSGSEDCTVKLWDRQGKLLRTFVDDRAPKVQNSQQKCDPQSSHQGDVLDVSFSPDGQSIVSASSDETLKIWQLDGTWIATLKGHTSKVNAVRFHPNGQLLVSASDDRTLKFWKRDGTLLKTLEAHPKWIHSVAFSHDGKTIASSSDDKTIKLWKWDGISLETLSLSETLEGHSDGVLQVSFHPTHNELASASEDKTIKIWHLDRKLDERRLTAHRDRVENISFSPDGRIVATASRDCTVKLWNIDGTLRTTLVDTSNNSEANTNNNCEALASHNDFVLASSFSPNGKFVATASRDCTVKLWNINGTLIRTFQDSQLKPGQDAIGETCRARSAHSDYVLGLSFSPNGRSIATSSRDKTIKLWSLDGKLLNTLRGHTQRVNSVSFSPNGELIASGGDDQTIRMWYQNGTLLRTIDKQENYDPGHTSYITSVSFSPDSQTLASAGWDNTVKLWDLNGKLLNEFTDSDSVNSVSFSPQGQVLAAGSWDGAIKLWSLQDGRLIKSLQGHDSGVLSVSFSPDGRTIASGSADETAILWDLDFDRLFQESCEWLSDYMTTNPNVTPDDQGLCDAAIGKP